VGPSAQESLLDRRHDRRRTLPAVLLRRRRVAERRVGPPHISPHRNS